MLRTNRQSAGRDPRNIILPQDPSIGVVHRQHLHAGWLYLERWGLPETLTRFSEDLLALSTTHGAPDRFHTTITWVFLFALDARRRELGDGHSWDELAQSSPELFDWRVFVDRYYTDELLWSDLARRSFILPDRLAFQPSPSAEKATASTVS